MTPIKSVKNFIYQKFCFMVARVLINCRWQAREFFQAVKASMVLSLMESDKKLKDIDIAAITGLDRRTIALIKKHGHILVQYFGVAKLTNILLKRQDKGQDIIKIKGGKNSLEGLVKRHIDQQVTLMAAKRELIRRGIVTVEPCGEKLKIQPWPLTSVHDPDIVAFAATKFYQIHEYQQMDEGYVRDLETDAADYLEEGKQIESVH